MSDHTTIPEGHKKCNRCGAVLPATAEYYHRDSSKKSGLRGQCKSCCNLKNRGAENREQHRLRFKAWRTENRERHNARKRAYYHAHQEQQREYRERNRERLIAWQRDYNRTRRPKPDREQKRQWGRNYRAAHAEEYRQYQNMWRKNNRDKVREYERAQRTKNPQYARTKTSQRRSAKKLAQGRYTSEDVRIQYDAQRGRCWWCGCTLGDNYHADHRIPLSRGGSNAPENIVLTCPRCNTSKGARLPSEWNGRLL